jgi:cytochrome c oxidase subunit 2
MGNMAQKGEALFQQLGCVTCHQSDGKGRCPKLAGLYGSKVELKGGAVVTADASYIRESIVNPLAKIVNGYEGIMPTFQGLVTEDQIQQLIEYVRSIGPPSGAAAAPGAREAGEAPRIALPGNPAPGAPKK